MKKIGIAMVLMAMLGASNGVWAAETKAAGAQSAEVKAVPAAPQAAAPAAADEKAAKPAAKDGAAAPAADNAAAEESADASDSTLEVAEAAIATGMENHQPVGAAEKFVPDAGKLYCYSKITGGQEGDMIVHKWMKGEEVMAQVNMKINGSPYRVYSVKSLDPEWTGKWSVQILQGDKVLKTLEFLVQ